MISPVIIKGNKMGIRLIIAPEASLETIVAELNDKLRNTGHYYKNIRPISVTFDGKNLTDDEIDTILDTLRFIGLNIEPHKTIQTDMVDSNNNNNIQPDKDGLFYIGNLKNGQSIDASESVIIVGDVEQGASVLSEGNIVIIGELSGYAEAGYKGREDAFVYSLISGRNSK